MKKPKLYVLVGVPGSGKSTWINNQTWADDCVVASTDAYVESHAKALGKTYNEVFAAYMPTAIKQMTARVLDARKQNKDIIWDQTSTTVGSRAKKLRMLPNYYKIAVVFPTPDKAELQRRLGGRAGKSIPPNVMQSMISGLSIPTEAEGFDEVWYA